MQRRLFSKFFDRIAQYSCIKLVFAANTIGVVVFAFF